MCEECRSFREFYFEGNPITLNEAMSAKSLLAMTEPKRQWRGDVDIVKKKLQIVDKDGNKKDLERLDYIVKAKNSTEKKTHWGFVDIDPYTNDVETLWCSCLDFATRFQIPFVKKGMSIIDVEHKYHKQELIRKGIGQNNGKWPKKMNPDGDLSLCKHLYFVIKYHLPDPTIKPKEAEKKEEPLKVIDKPSDKVKEPKTIDTSTVDNKEPSNVPDVPIEAPEEIPEVPKKTGITAPSKPRPIEKRSIMNPTGKQLDKKKTLIPSK